jgi:hypothetical protein
LENAISVNPKPKPKQTKLMIKCIKKSVNTQNTSLKHRILPLKDEKSLEREYPMLPIFQQ